MSLQASYILNDVIASLGPDLLEGGGASDFISIKRVTESWSDEVGAMGTVVRSSTNDYRGEAILTLMQTDPLVGQLQALCNVDEATGEGVLPFSLFDPATGREYFARQAWVQGHPEEPFNRAVGEVQITIRMAKLIVIPTEVAADIFGVVADALGI